MDGRTDGWMGRVSFLLSALIADSRSLPPLCVDTDDMCVFDVYLYVRTIIHSMSGDFQVKVHPSIHPSS